MQIKILDLNDQARPGANEQSRWLRFGKAFLSLGLAKVILAFGLALPFVACSNSSGPNKITLDVSGTDYVYGFDSYTPTGDDTLPDITIQADKIIARLHDRGEGIIIYTDKLKADNGGVLPAVIKALGSDLVKADQLTIGIMDKYAAWIFETINQIEKGTSVVNLMYQALNSNDPLIRQIAGKMIELNGNPTAQQIYLRQLVDDHVKYYYIEAYNAGTDGDLQIDLTASNRSYKNAFAKTGQIPALDGTGTYLSYTSGLTRDAVLGIQAYDKDYDGSKDLFSLSAGKTVEVKVDFSQVLPGNASLLLVAEDENKNQIYAPIVAGQNTINKADFWGSSVKGTNIVVTQDPANELATGDLSFRINDPVYPNQNVSTLSLTATSTADKSALSYKITYSFGTAKTAGEIQALLKAQSIIVYDGTAKAYTQKTLLDYATISGDGLSAQIDITNAQLNSDFNSVAGYTFGGLASNAYFGFTIVPTGAWKNVLLQQGVTLNSQTPDSANLTFPSGTNSKSVTIGTVDRALDNTPIAYPITSASVLKLLDTAGKTGVYVAIGDETAKSENSKTSPDLNLVAQHESSWFFQSTGSDLTFNLAGLPLSSNLVSSNLASLTPSGTTGFNFQTSSDPTQNSYAGIDHVTSFGIAPTDAVSFDLTGVTGSATLLIKDKNNNGLKYTGTLNNGANNLLVSDFIELTRGLNQATVVKGADSYTAGVNFVKSKGSTAVFYAADSVDFVLQDAPATAFKFVVKNKTALTKNNFLKTLGFMAFSRTGNKLDHDGSQSIFDLATVNDLGGGDYELTIPGGMLSGDLVHFGTLDNIKIFDKNATVNLSFDFMDLQVNTGDGTGYSVNQKIFDTFDYTGAKVLSFSYRGAQVSGALTNASIGTNTLDVNTKGTLLDKTKIAYVTVSTAGGQTINLRAEVDGTNLKMFYIPYGDSAKNNTEKETDNFALKNVQIGSGGYEKIGTSSFDFTKITKIMAVASEIGVGNTMQVSGFKVNDQAVPFIEYGKNFDTANGAMAFSISTESDTPQTLNLKFDTSNPFWKSANVLKNTQTAQSFWDLHPQGKTDYKLSYFDYKKTNVTSRDDWKKNLPPEANKKLNKDKKNGKKSNRQR